MGRLLPLTSRAVGRAVDVPAVRLDVGNADRDVLRDPRRRGIYPVTHPGTVSGSIPWFASDREHASKVTPATAASRMAAVQSFVPCMA